MRNESILKHRNQKYFLKEVRMTNSITKIISFVSSKGGAGKSSLAILLANFIAACGRNVLVIDTDFSNSTTLYYLQNRVSLQGKGFGNAIKEKNVLDHITGTNHENIDIIPSSSNIEKLEIRDKSLLGELLKNDDAVQGVYDYIIIDTSQGYNAIVRAAICASDIVLTPVMLCQFDLMSCITLRAKIIEDSNKYNNWFIFFNGVNHYAQNRRSNHYQYISLYKRTFENCLDVYIPHTASVANAIDRSIPIKRRNNEKLHGAIFHLANHLFPDSELSDIEAF
jgi:chromosome partitioning protein